MQISRWFDNFRALSRPEYRLAWAIALAADAVQIGLFPLFAAGGASPANSALDVLVAFVMTKILGWHWAFLPSLAAELLPGFDLFPTWTAAVWFVTRQQAHPEEPEILPAEPVRPH